MMGGTTRQSIHAAAIALKTRSAWSAIPSAASSKCLASSARRLRRPRPDFAQLALAGVESVIPMDEIVEAMVRIGRALSATDFAKPPRADWLRLSRMLDRRSPEDEAKPTPRGTGAEEGTRGSGAEGIDSIGPIDPGPERRIRRCRRSAASSEIVIAMYHDEHRLTRPQFSTVQADGGSTLPEQVQARGENCHARGHRDSDLNAFPVNAREVRRRCSS